MKIRKNIARVVERMAKECVESRAEKSSPIWTYEEPFPEEVKKWLEKNKRSN